MKTVWESDCFVSYVFPLHAYRQSSEVGVISLGLMRGCYNQMLALRNIIIDRLRDIAAFQKEIADSLIAPSPPQKLTETSGFKLLSIRRKYQQIEHKRLCEELGLIKELSQSAIPIQEVAVVCLQIIRCAGSQHVLTGQWQEEELYCQIRKIMGVFLQKQDCAKMQHVVRTLASTERIAVDNFVVWLDEWSKVLFHQTVTQQKEKHLNNRCLPSFTSNAQYEGSPSKYLHRKVKTEQGDSPLLQSQFRSIQGFYSCIKPELSSYYAFHECIDLDMDFLYKMRRSTRPLETLNLSQISHLLIRYSNSQTSMTRSNYRTVFEERTRQRGSLVDSQFTRNNRKRESLINQTEGRFASFGGFNRARSINYPKLNVDYRKSPKLYAFYGQEEGIVKSKGEGRNGTVEKMNLDFDRLNFVSRNPRKSTYKQLNYTTLLYSHKGFNGPIKMEGGVPEIIKESIQRQTEKVFVMEGSEGSRGIFEDSRSNWEQTKLKYKKCLVRAGREQAFKPVSFNSLIISNN